MFITGELKLWGAQRTTGPNVGEAIDQFEFDIFLGLTDTLSEYSLFQQAKFKRALLTCVYKNKSTTKPKYAYLMPI